MTTSMTVPQPTNGGATTALLRFLASLLPWVEQGDARARWEAAARSAPPRERKALLLHALGAVAMWDRCAPADPVLAHAAALGRLRLAAAFLLCAVLYVSTRISASCRAVRRDFSLGPLLTARA